MLEKQDLEAIDELIRTRIEESEARTNKRFEAVDQRFEAMDKRFEAVDKRFEDLETRMDKRFEEMRDSRSISIFWQRTSRYCRRRWTGSWERDCLSVWKRRRVTCRF